MESFLTSTLLVGVAEIGDKTQLLAFALACRFQRPWPLLAGIAVATLLNHALAGAAGAVAAAWLDGPWFRLAIAASFAAMAVYVLIPDRLDDEPRWADYGPFITATVAFFVAEMGDKTQIATIALAAEAEHVVAVVAGSTLGLLAVNAPVALAGKFAAERLPLRAIRLVAAALFLAMAVATAWSVLGK